MTIKPRTPEIADLAERATNATIKRAASPNLTERGAANATSIKRAGPDARASASADLGGLGALGGNAVQSIGDTVGGVTQGLGLGNIVQGLGNIVGSVKTRGTPFVVRPRKVRFVA